MFWCILHRKSENPICFHYLKLRISLSNVCKWYFHPKMYYPQKWKCLDYICLCSWDPGLQSWSISVPHLSTRTHYSKKHIASLPRDPFIILLCVTFLSAFFLPEDRIPRYSWCNCIGFEQRKFLYFSAGILMAQCSHKYGYNWRFYSHYVTFSVIFK